MLHVFRRPPVHRITSSKANAPPPLRSLPLLRSPTVRLYTAGTAPDHDPLKPSHDVAVVGAGISGLASAYYLARELPNARITLYEAKEHLGGWLESKRVPVKGGSVLFEPATRTIRPQANGVLTASLMQELDLAKDAIFTQRTSPAARNRYVYYPDHLVRMPHPAHGLAENLWSLWTEPVFKGAIWSGLTEFSKGARDSSVRDESIGDFFSRRLGRPMVDRLLSAIIHGIYAGDVWQLSARSLFPTPYRDEAQHGSIVSGMLYSRAEGVELTRREADFLQEMKDFAWDPLLKATLRDTSVFTFKDGAKMLADRLHSSLFETGRVEFKSGTQVKSITQAEGNSGVRISTVGSEELRTHTHVISAVAPWQLNEMTKSDTRSHLVPNVPSVTVMVVNLYFRTPGLHEPGFGYLIPRATPFENNPERALGVVFDEGYSPGPSDLDPKNWEVLDIDQLKAAREQGRMINVNDFAWYNMPARPNMQDDVESRGTKVTVMLGGHWWDGWPSYPDEKEGLALARSLLERQLGITEEPEAWVVSLQKNCIPQYTVGHEDRLKQAHNTIWREFKGRLRVVGNWMSGVGLNDCIRSAYDVAKTLSKDGTGLQHVGEAPTVRLKPVRTNKKTSEED